MKKERIVQVVTGGAGGMGLAICRRIADRGTIFLVDNDRESIEIAKQKLERNGIEDVEYIECDISDRIQVESLVEKVAKTGVLGNCIHTAAYAPVQKSAERIMEVNAIGTLNIIDTFFNLMTKGSSMVTVTSIAGHALSISDPLKQVFGDAHASDFHQKMMNLCKSDEPRMRAGMAYCFSKAFNMYYTKQNTRRYSQKGARIMTVSAGIFATPMGLADMPGGVRVLKDLPIGRWGDPDEIAATVEFLTSPDASYITGIDLLVDGGYRAEQDTVQLDQVL